MCENYVFDDIRPYNDSEVNQYINILLNDPGFHRILRFIFRDEKKIAGVAQLLSGIHTIKDLQGKFMYPLIEELILKPTTKGVTCTGLENLDVSKSYLIISNHRDIILDSAILNYLIFREGMHTTEVAIGDNLLIADWIEHAVKLNRAFEVKRNLPVSELMVASKKLSAYIRQDITERNISVWIAQREGRTKDGCDKTQPSLLKMINLSNEKSFREGFRDLRIVPLSISYEIEPCGISKVAELYKKETEGFVKTQADDLKSMAYGLMNPKGRINFSFGRPMMAAIDEMDKKEQLSEKIEALADYIDQRIYRNYKLWPNNYIAADMLRNENKYVDGYDRDEYSKFAGMLNEALAMINGDAARIREMFLQMYANPVINRENLTNPNGYF
ncbi:MAG: 1-acyl-sn-glycerol-3-phosphate acyltransferase [Prolixibacteraceae bacterium]|jgi:1-acyl-sn-glycerol-3-phosphate acyltransferase|nr:1-acyl-sn-glycerol-3-phosphate acyltransferase [Prolixibacteraceae bacterium]